ncbi:hypothetical protein FG264_14830 [Listeria monocytogenes]|nr:hypothetical protein [Listeria monocytogenes]EAW7167997.1 hypothetical protein [Listeria monocytogenes]EHC5262613.1 hypothetical protein [Listeria monocytogenes serotype 1/2a]EJS9299455.1 hypothetical protein [Listeria monocytogenes]UHP11647.1 hypothetical protein LAX80_014240 [Listeria marthii]
MDLKKILEANESIEEKVQQVNAYFQSELITRTEASKLLDVSPITLDRYIKQQKLVPFINKDRNILLKESDVLAFKPEVTLMKKRFNK